MRGGLLPADKLREVCALGANGAVAMVGDVASVVRLSRATLANIHQNVAGVTGSWPAILAETGATVLVVANALRLLRHRF